MRAALQAALKNTSQFERVIQNAAQFGEYYTHVGQSSEGKDIVDQMVERLKDPAQFDRLIKGAEDFFNIASALETNNLHLKTLFDMLLDNSSVFKRVIKRSQPFYRMMKSYPDYSNALIQRVINHADDHPSVFDSVRLLRSITAKFPNYKDQVLSLLDAGSEHHKHLIEKIGQLDMMRSFFPEKAAEYVKYLLNNMDEFKRLVTALDDVINFAEKFPQHAEVFIEIFIDEPSLFKDLVKTHDDLKTLAKQFPQYAVGAKNVFGRASTDEAIRFLKSRAEIRKNMRQITRIGSTPSLFRKMMPPEMIIQIAANTRDPSVMSETDARIIAASYLPSPVSVSDPSVATSASTDDQANEVSSATTLGR